MQDPLRRADSSSVKRAGPGVEYLSVSLSSNTCHLSLSNSFCLGFLITNMGLVSIQGEALRNAQWMPEKQKQSRGKRFQKPQNALLAWMKNLHTSTSLVYISRDLPCFSCLA